MQPSSLPSSSARSEQGFSLTEALVATAVMLLLFSAAIPALQHTTLFSRTIGDTSAMHGSVRGATELLQQEIGQAGRVTLPGPATLTANVVKGANSVALSSVAGLFVGAQIVVGAGDQAETVALTAVAAPNVTAVFGLDHNAGEPIAIRGGFASGIVPPAMANGSTGNVLKIYGDINDDGSLVYVEYICDLVKGKLYRNMMESTVGAKPAVTESMALLNNIIANPGGAPCFTYQTQIVLANTFVTGVAVTLSVRSEQKDRHTTDYLRATKTLLNVSPRNIFLVWSMASIGITNRTQPMPPVILALLP